MTWIMEPPTLAPEVMEVSVHNLLNSKLKKTGLAGLALLLAASAQAQSGAGQSPGAAGSAQNFTRPQLSAQLDARFKAADTNGDKSLSSAEVEAVQSRSAAEATAEIAKRIQDEFNQLDADRNGQLTLSEFKAGAPGPRVTPASEIIRQLDTNKDGKIGQEEFKSAPLASFDRFDTNKDGTISPQEQSAAASRRQ